MTEQAQETAPEPSAPDGARPVPGDASAPEDEAPLDEGSEAADDDEGPRDPPPSEIEQDVLGHLRELDLATGAALPVEAMGQTTAQPHDPGSFDASFGLTSALELDPTAAPPRQPRAPLTPDFRPQTLEDLYAEYHQLRTGEYSLRVVRDAPASYAGQDGYRGWIEDLHEPVTMGEFKDAFGGGRYTLTVMAGAAGRVNADGSPDRRSLASVKVNIQGPPRQRDDNMRREFSVLSGGNHPQVETKRLDVEAKEKEYLQRKLDEANEARLEAVRGRGLDWSTVTDLTERQAESMRQAHAESLGVLRGEVQDKAQQLARMEKQLEEAKAKSEELERRLRDEVHEERTKRLEQARKEETEQIRQLKTEHEREMNRERTTYNERIERMQSEHTRRIEEMQARAERDRKDDQDRHERQLNAQASEHSRTLQAAETRHQNELQHVERMYAGRMQDLERSTKAQMESVRESSRMQLEGVQLAAQTESKSTETLARGQQGLMEMQLRTMESELQAVRSENDRLREELMSRHKTPHEAVDEARKLLDSLGLTGKDENPDWKGQLAGIFRNLTDKLPEIARGAAEVRAHNQQIHAQRAAAAPVQRAPHQFAAPAAGPPPPARAPIQRPRQVAPPGFDPDTGYDPDGSPRAASPLGHSGDGHIPGATPIGGREEPYPVIQPPPDPPGPAYHTEPVYPGQQPPPQHAPPAQPVQHQAPPPQQAQPAQHAAPPAAALPAPAQAQMGPPVAPEPHEQEPDAGPSPQEFVVQEPAFQPAPARDLTEEQRAALSANEDQIGTFINQLEEAIAGGVIGPKAFASGFVEQIGPEGAAAFVAQLSPTQFRAMLKEAKTPHVKIHTYDGKEYLNACWAEVRRLTGG